MCFKKPKLPPKPPEQIALEKEAEEARIARKIQLERDLATEKEATTEAALARALGFTGNRSLIAGPRGGAGYLGAGSNKMRGGRRRIGSASPVVSLLPPAASPAPVAVAGGSTTSSGSTSGFSSGSGGGTSRSPTLVRTYAY